MIVRSAAVIAAFLVSAAVPGGEATAQYYSSQPPAAYRGSPQSSVYDRGPPAGGYFGENDGSSDALPPPGLSRQPRGAMPYPHEADAAVPPAPAFASPDGRPAPGPYGHEIGSSPASADGPDVMRPPGSVGGVPAAAPAPASPQGAAALPPEDQPEQGAPKELSPELRRQLVNYTTKEPAGTLIVDTQHTFLYLVLGSGKALRYGIGVGREGFTWNGTERVSRMKEWPDWYPPAEMIERQPYLPRMMAGGEGNPLGARALYLGNTLYRIHGTNQPSTIGTFVSSGCIRLLNSDIEDLYSRVQVGTRVVVLPGGKPPEVASTAAPASQAPQAQGSQMRSNATGSISSSALPPPPARR